ncbi:Emopamil-binding protein [Corynespora cassiicola Philippines]|uniref:Emopamil-binding protein n=1 Tax=Corynespora cassiicola Philippines TaxID=1448308 RepID=A0A2T2PB11_CORCC|nr:Emopamil-binding protein [Corynespora cassiicola Philippines]
MAWGRASSPSPPPPPPPRAPPIPRSSPTIDATTILSLLTLLSLLGGAYAASVRFLPRTSSLKTRILFVWHLFDALVHLVFEGSFLYNCFCVSYALPTSFSAAARHHPHIRLLTPPDVYWLGHEDRLYGANYGEGPFSRLWQEYAKADKRWGGVDLTVVSLEILTVGVGAPLALWICAMLRTEERKGVLKRWFWMSLLATAELYGGWMTFAPEWLTGSPNLDTSNWMYL